MTRTSTSRSLHPDHPQCHRGCDTATDTTGRNSGLGEAIRILVFLVAGFLPLHTAGAQGVGEVTSLDLAGGQATFTLDFADREYQLILYASVTDEPDTSRTFAFTVSSSTASGKPVAAVRYPRGFASSQVSAEGELRMYERQLAETIRQQGGWHQGLARIAGPAQEVRTFTFSQIGNVSTDQTVQATLVASSSKALGYLDNDLGVAEGIITAGQIQTMLDRFSRDTFPTVVDGFGAPSDVDGNGVVVFLFTGIVDEVGGVSGFYSSRSLFPTDRGGNGNLSDMMFISPTRTLDFYDPLLAHEFQHLVNYNQHMLVRNGKSETSWLNEALSHYAEDLVDGHVEGDLPRLYRQFMKAPETYSLIGDATLNDGIRGAAYLFLHGLVQDYGADISRRLVESDLAGIANVEAETGRDFSDLFRAHALRLFMSGTGLNNVAEYSYTFPAFSEPVTGQRSLPLPKDIAVSAAGPPVSGEAKPVAPAYLRLTGEGTGVGFTLETETAGAFRALLIPLPAGYRPWTSVAADHFPEITFDAPLEGSFTAGEGVRITGASTDPAATEILFRFEPRDGKGDTIRFSSEIAGGRFSRSILFHPSRVGSYALSLFVGQDGSSLPFVGSLSSVVVVEGSGELSLPTDFFPGIAFDEPMPGALSADQGIFLSGSVDDLAADQFLLRFEPLSSQNDTVRVFVEVSEGRFAKNILLVSSQAGDYSLSVFIGQKGVSMPLVGQFSFVSIVEGDGEVTLPTDFFSGIILDEPFPGELPAGEGIKLSGSVDDAVADQILLRLEPRESGNDTIRFYIDVAQGHFAQSILLDPSQAGGYSLSVFLGQTGFSLPRVGAFSSITVTEGTGVVRLPVDTFTGITLDAPFRTTLIVGREALFSGTVSDPSVDILAVRFDPASEGGQRIQLMVPVSGGKFAQSLSFAASETGSYTLILFAGQSGGSLPFLDSFDKIHVLSSRPDILVGPRSLDFGKVFTGETGSASLTVTNLGSETLSVTGIESDDAQFSVSPTTFSLTPDDSAKVSLSFAPASAGAATGILAIASNDPGRPTVQIDLSALGVAPDVPEPPQVVTVPVDYFTGLVLAEPLPTSFVSGAGVRVSGTVADSSVSWIFLRFRDQADADKGVLFGFDVVGRTFDRSIVFHPTQSGEYELVLYMGQKGGDVPKVGAYTTVAVSEGEGDLQLPEDYFSRVLLDEPMPIDYHVDEAVDISGAVSDSQVEQLLFRFDPLGGEGQQVGFISDVVDGRFTLSIDFESSLAGTYRVSLFMGERDGSLPIVARFSPVTVVEAAAVTADFDGNGSVNFADFLALAMAYGSTEGDEGYNPKFDLNGNGRVDFPDFISLAQAYGT